MLETPFELLSCTWPRPVAESDGRWASEPEWGAPLMPSRPEPRWRSVGGELCWTVDWREWFKRGLGLDCSSLGGQMRGFHVVFRLRVRAGGRLVFFDDDGSVVRRGGLVLHRASGARDDSRREIEVAAGDELEVAQWQRGGSWTWAARVARDSQDESDLDARRALAPYLEAVMRRLERPEGPPVKLYTSGSSAVRAVVCLYSLVLNGYAPSKVLLFGEYQWSAEARSLFADLMPFAEVVHTDEVRARLHEAGGARLTQAALRYWFVMKTFVALLCPPREFCLMDDDVFVLERVDDALEAFRAHELVYTPDVEHSDEYLKRWGWLHGRLGEPLKTADFNAGLYFARHDFDPRRLARETSRVRPQYCEPYVWEQGYIANLFAHARTLSLPTQRYLFPLSDGLPGGPLGYDYARNPCGFTTVHFAGLSEKPSDAATLLLLPHVLGRALRDTPPAPPAPTPLADEAPPAGGDAQPTDDDTAAEDVEPPHDGDQEPARDEEPAGDEEPARDEEPAHVFAEARADDVRVSVRERAPLVSCVMPTADRRAYVPQAIRYFQRQDYPNLELVILDDGRDSIADCVPAGDARVRYLRLAQKTAIGAKRNLACEEARGRFIVHWDDDDWYPSWRVSAQVRALDEGGFDVCGTSRLFYFEPAGGRAWQYRYARPGKVWVAGNTLAFRKSFWERQRFAAVREGEDTRFVLGAPPARVRDLDDPRLCVATVHASNTSRKVTAPPFWQRQDASDLRDLLGEDFDFYLALGRAARDGVDGGDAQPLVSCIMPTRDRRPFVRLALEQFARQDYPRKELIVVDDGSDPVGDLVESVEGATYLRLTRSATIGAKRNLACARARGSLVAHWDDDDWYAPGRLSYQARPIVAGEADLTGLAGDFVMVLPGGEFWTALRPLHARLFVGDVHGGTLVFRKSIFDEGLRYPSSNLAEDASLIKRALARGRRLVRLDNAGEFVYVRHGRNAWREFAPGEFLDPEGWRRTDAPDSFPAEALGAYRTAAAAL